jgi:Xaa-Pro dipeptidase
MMTDPSEPPPPEFKRTPLPERLCNLGRLLDTMEQRGMDGVVSYLRPNVLYLSGFAPPASASVHETNGYAAVVISRHAPEHPVIVLAEFDLAHFLGQPSWIRDTRPYATLLTPFESRGRSLTTLCRRRCSRPNAARRHGLTTPRA